MSLDFDLEDWKDWINWPTESVETRNRDVEVFTEQSDSFAPHQTDTDLADVANGLSVQEEPSHAAEGQPVISDISLDNDPFDWYTESSLAMFQSSPSVGTNADDHESTTGNVEISSHPNSPVIEKSVTSNDGRTWNPYERDENGWVPKPYARQLRVCLLEIGGTERAASLKQIYEWYRQNTEIGYKNGNNSDGWCNSVRHNLSMNEAFESVDRTVWRLTDEAFARGTIMSTSTYRPENRKKKGALKRRPTSEGPAKLRTRTSRGKAISTNNRRITRSQTEGLRQVDTISSAVSKPTAQEATFNTSSILSSVSTTNPSSLFSTPALSSYGITRSLSEPIATHQVHHLPPSLCHSAPVSRDQTPYDGSPAIQSTSLQGTQFYTPRNTMWTSTSDNNELMSTQSLMMAGTPWTQTSTQSQVPPATLPGMFHSMSPTAQGISNQSCRHANAHMRRQCTPHDYTAMTIDPAMFSIPLNNIDNDTVTYNLFDSDPYLPLDPDLSQSFEEHLEQQVPFLNQSPGPWYA